MGWKNWPSWLKGGVIGLIISVILVIFALLTSVISIFALFGVLIIFMINWFTRCEFNSLESYSCEIPLALGIPIFLLEFFILGALIGWICRTK